QHQRDNASNGRRREARPTDKEVVERRRVGVISVICAGVRRRGTQDLELREMRSPFTAGHSVSVTSLAAGAGRVLGPPDRVIWALRRAGLLHDPGRAGVPVAVWNKTEALGED